MMIFRAITILAATTLAIPAALAQGIAVPGASDHILRSDGAILRGLDRVAGTTIDFDAQQGQETHIGHLVASVRECRYPADNPASEAYAWIDIHDTRADQMLFSGWMIASSPALNALDHARYDLWVLRCKTS
ncbi:DUF2155 domain-containing protein [Roseinatronobacter alkalisoli]|uniref:DUF2155 domain-containing protein n=1 Tax=Roseinatronobacter alkalisoli TaxID=3028235 RepID=A0ABT5T8H5_9RHOB|nr:DUF2155 domain-containing protein [Roseinatronobacter sp. HJB301]MDD7971423.1 DUF2155 domain-containing protein [Roseinatronobacter sp. HJB301]